MLRLAAGGEAEALRKGEAPEPAAIDPPRIEPDTREALRKALRKLPARQRAAVMAFAQDRTAELRERLGVSRQRLFQLRERALRKLREDLRPE
jgi:DNA-directed RNA polymerase specialized sigma subunit